MNHMNVFELPGYYCTVQKKSHAIWVIFGAPITESQALALELKVPCNSELGVAWWPVVFVNFQHHKPLIRESFQDYH